MPALPWSVRRRSDGALLGALVLAAGSLQLGLCQDVPAPVVTPAPLALGAAASAAQAVPAHVSPFCDDTYHGHGSSQGCKPFWYNTSSDTTCPYGTLLPGDVTYGYPIYSCQRHNEESQCNVAWVVNLICVVYGYMPFIVIGVAIVELLCTRGTRELCFVSFVGILTLVNEGVIKKLIMRRRPIGSCALTCGMPSSHSTFAVGFFVLLFLDASARVNPMDVHEGESASTWGKTLWRWLCRRELQFLRGPLSNPVSISNEAFIFLCSQWGVLLLPVPISRVALADHSFDQVVIGGLLGMFFACLFYYCVYLRIAKAVIAQPDWSWPRRWSCPLLTNTITLPWWAEEMVDTTADELMAAENLKSVHHIRMPLMSEDVLNRRGSDMALSANKRGTMDDILIRIEDCQGKLVDIRRGRRLKGADGSWDGIAWPCPRRNVVREEENNAESGSDESDFAEGSLCALTSGRGS